MRPWTDGPFAGEMAAHEATTAAVRDFWRPCFDRRIKLLMPRAFPLWKCPLNGFKGHFQNGIVSRKHTMAVSKMELSPAGIQWSFPKWNCLLQAYNGHFQNGNDLRTPTSLDSRKVTASEPVQETFLSAKGLLLAGKGGQRELPDGRQGEKRGCVAATGHDDKHLRCRRV